MLWYCDAHYGYLLQALPLGFAVNLTSSNNMSRDSLGVANGMPNTSEDLATKQTMKISRTGEVDAPSMMNVVSRTLTPAAAAALEGGCDSTSPGAPTTAAAWHHTQDAQISTAA